MQTVLAEHAFFSQVAELGVGDRARGAAVVHGVAPNTRRIRRLDDDIAAQVGHLAAVFSPYHMFYANRPIQRQPSVADRSEGPFFREGSPPVTPGLRVPC